VCVTVVEALTHAAVLRRPDILSGGKAERFVDDTTRLLARYLRASDPDGRAAKRARDRAAEKKSASLLS
jgi:hypothetical protein